MSDFFDFDVCNRSAFKRVPGQRQASVTHDSAHDGRSSCASTISRVGGAIIFNHASPTETSCHDRDLVFAVALGKLQLPRLVVTSVCLVSAADDATKRVGALGRARVR